MIDGELLLHEELLLLGLHDRTGKLIRRATPIAMSGGLLAEMLFAGRIELVGGVRPDVDVVSEEPLADPVLDLMFERVRNRRGAETLDWWVRDLAREKQLVRWTAEELCEGGILKQKDAGILSALTTTRFPEIDPGPERAVKKRIRDAVQSDAPTVHERTAALIALAHHAGLLRGALRRSGIDAHLRRIDAMCDATEVAGATDHVIRTMRNSRTLAFVLAAVLASGR